jgi:hydrogenase maturation protein HypF
MQRTAERGLRVRHRLSVHGLVQGVGFRPFVYALARELGLSGLVGNTAAGVHVEVEGSAAGVAEFGRRVVADAPVLARVDGLAVDALPCRGGTDFVIEESHGGSGRTLVSPDVATCDACRAELADPADRRYRHAFISCTNCGPRFTVVVDLPYDRPATTMAQLPLCARCAAEYADPADRRFHAQTVACPDCGPMSVLAHPGEPDRFGDTAIAATRTLLAGGAIVAIKGIGGYHLACDATDENAVTTLRKRKDRGDKPFAVIVADLAAARAIAVVSSAEAALLTDPRRPVVLLAKRSGSTPLARSVTPDSPDVGVLLAYTPVHHLLFGLAGDRPGPAVLVMTSGNVSGEPIVIDDAEAQVRLAGLADAWLGNDRAIHVPCDDSVLRVAADGPLPVRRSRGYAPLPVALPVDVRPALAVGGDLKNTFCVGEGAYAWLSAHVGDMDDLATVRAFETATTHLGALTGVRPELIVADRHPAYRSSGWAARNPAGLPVRSVQHHHAHVASALAENGHDGSRRVIGFAFDGTGYGDDGAVWGGEALLFDYDGYHRAGHLAYVPLPGGDAGVRNPCRMALSHLRAAGVEWDDRLPSVAACSPTERRVLARQLETGLRCTPTSSMGRLFDAVSSLAGACQRTSYEAEAAMRFEGLARDAIEDCGTPYAFAGFDAGPLVAAVARDALAGVPAAVIAARFHLAVVNLVVDVAVGLRETHGLDEVALSGGVFLNALLTTGCARGLADRGLRVLRHRIVPPSDAGLALGQLVIAARTSTE